MTYSTDLDGNHVEPAHIAPEPCWCPKCNESRQAYLAWDDNDYLNCATCGAKYDPYKED